MIKDFFQVLLDRITAGWRTTIVGLLIWAATAYVFFTQGLDWEMLIIGILAGGFLIALKDKPNSNIGGGAAALLMGFVLLSALSCQSIKQVPVNTNKTSVKSDSVAERIVERLVPVPYEVPGDTVRISIPAPCDSLGKVVNGSYTVKGSRANLKFDMKNGIITATAICNELRDSIYAKEVEIDRLKASKANNEIYKEVPVKVEVPVEYIPKWVFITLAISIFTGIYWLVKLTRFIKSFIP